MSQNLYSSSRAGSRLESGQRNSQRRSGTKGIRGEREIGVGMDVLDKRRDGRRAEATTGRRSGGSKEKGKGKRVRRNKRDEPLIGKRTASKKETAVTMEEELKMDVGGGMGRRRLLSIDKDWTEEDGQAEIRVEVSYLSSAINQQQTDDNQFSFNLKSLNTLRENDFILRGNRGSMNEENLTHMDSLSSSFDIHHRSPRSLLSPTLQPSLSTLSLLYQFGAGEEHTLLPQTVPLSLQRGTSLLSPPLSPLFSSTTSTSSSLLSVRPKMNDFARKVEGFWILRELQSWLWRSAKDFNRLKKRLRGWDNRKNN